AKVVQLGHGLLLGRRLVLLGAEGRCRCLQVRRGRLRVVPDRLVRLLGELQRVRDRVRVWVVRGARLAGWLAYGLRRPDVTDLASAGVRDSSLERVSLRIQEVDDIAI